MGHRITSTARIALVIALTGLTAALLGSAAAGAAPTPTTPPTRYVRDVCAALDTWLNAGTADPTAQLRNLESGEQSPKGARQQVVHIYAAAMTATDRLIATTEKVGAPRMANGQQVATDYLQTLGDLRDALIAAHHAAERTTTSNRAVLIKTLANAVRNLINTVAAIGDPLTTLNGSPTLAAAIQGDSGCANVLDFFRTAASSGLKIGDCTTQDEQQVECSQPHWGEVTLVTAYPGDATTPWPGNDAMNAFVDQACGAAFAAYVGVSEDQSPYTYGWFHPNAGSNWDGGDREIVCTVISPDNSPMTGSVKGNALS